MDILFDDFSTTFFLMNFLPRLKKAEIAKQGKINIKSKRDPDVTRKFLAILSGKFVQLIDLRWWHEQSYHDTIFNTTVTDTSERYLRNTDEGNPLVTREVLDSYDERWGFDTRGGTKQK